MLNNSVKLPISEQFISGLRNYQNCLEVDSEISMPDFKFMVLGLLSTSSVAK